MEETSLFFMVSYLDYLCDTFQMQNIQYSCQKSMELFSQNNVNLFVFSGGNIYKTMKNLKKILGGYGHGKFDRRI